MTIRDLIRDYDIKIRLLEGMIEAETNKFIIDTLKAKLRTYQSFLTDLKAVKSM